MNVHDLNSDQQRHFRKLWIWFLLLGIRLVALTLGRSPNLGLGTPRSGRT